MGIQDELDIFDLYILSNNGIPIFAGCTVSDYCMSHSDQHPLHAGFMTALLSFGREVFSGDLKNLSFPAVKLNFRSAGNDHKVVFVNPSNAKDELIQEKLDKVADVFLDKYIGRIKHNSVTDDDFYEFQDDMVKLGLLPQDRLQSTRAYFITEEGITEEQTSSIFQSFKNKFKSLIRKN